MPLPRHNLLRKEKLLEMSYSNERLESIFEKTEGWCHICWKQLCFSNYAQLGRRGAWEVEHSNPRAKGGSDHLNNLFAAHIPCNRSKGASSSRSARAANGKTRAPRSRVAQDKERAKNTASGATAGGLVGTALGGPPGGALGVLIGGLLGNGRDTK